jgi:hypothetical protein
VAERVGTLLLAGAAASSHLEMRRRVDGGDKLGPNEKARFLPGLVAPGLCPAPGETTRRTRSASAMEPTEIPSDTTVP